MPWHLEKETSIWQNVFHEINPELPSLSKNIIGSLALKLMGANCSLKFLSEESLGYCPYYWQTKEGGWTSRVHGSLMGVPSSPELTQVTCSFWHP